MGLVAGLLVEVGLEVRGAGLVTVGIVKLRPPGKGTVVVRVGTF